MPRKILIVSLARNGRAPSKLYVKTIVRLLRLLGLKLVTVNEALAAPFGRFGCLTFDGPAAATLARLAPALASLNVPATLFVATSDVEVGRHAGWLTLRALKAKGWEIGTLGHEAVNLTDCSASDQRRLVTRAKALLASHLGAEPKLFAYPFGAYDATTVSCIKDEGFTAAVTLRPSLNNGESESEPFHLRRVPLVGELLRDAFCLTRIVLGRLPHALPAPKAGTERERLHSGAAL